MRPGVLRSFLFTGALSLFLSSCPAAIANGAHENDSHEQHHHSPTTKPKSDDPNPTGTNGVVSDRWKDTELRPHPDHRLCYQIAIKHDEKTVDNLYRTLADVSSPISSSYSEWYSQSDIRNLLEESGSLPTSRLAIRDFLTERLPSINIHDAVVSDKLIHHGTTELTSWCGRCRSSDQLDRYSTLPWASEAATGDFFAVCSTVQQAEELLKTKLTVYKHLVDGSEAIRSNQPLDLPETLSKHIDFIGGINTPIHRNVANVKKMSNIGHMNAQMNVEMSAMSPRDIRDSPPLKPIDERLLDESDECGNGVSSADILSIIAGNEEFNLIWEVKCKDGHPSTSSEDRPPCFTPVSDNIDDDNRFKSSTPYVRSFDLVVRDQFERARAFKIPASACKGARCTASVPLNNYDPLRVQVHTLFSDDSCSGSILSDPVAAVEFATIHFLQDLYGIPSGLRVRNKSSTIAVVEFLEQYYNPNDLDDYLTLHGLERDSKIDGPFLVGPNVPDIGKITGGEAQLDIQVAMGLAQGAPMWFWSVPQREARKTYDINDGSQEPFLAWLFDLSDAAHPPLVQSVSYGDLEVEIVGAYAQRLNVEFAKLGLRGITIIVAAGDSGVNGEPNVPEQPQQPKNKNTPPTPPPTPGARDPNTDVHDISNTIKIKPSTAESSALCKRSSPNFPASSPFVLSVGGTQLSSRGSPMCQRRWHGTMIGCSPREVVCSAIAGGIITSGGGFSHHYPTPHYQEDFVRHYLSNGERHNALPESSFFTRTGRGYPDITAYGTAYPILMNGSVVPVAGTSASTPVMASIVALWNDARLSEGLPPVGFINPLLYELARESPEVYNDVIAGDNSCAERGQACCPRGFKAQPGWDAASGLGSPKFVEIRDQIIATAKHAQRVRTSKHNDKETSRVENLNQVTDNMMLNSNNAAGQAWIIMAALLMVGIVWMMVASYRKRVNMDSYDPVSDSEKMPTRRSARDDHLYGGVASGTELP